MPAELEETLKVVPGVRKAVVDLAGGTAEVVYEPAATGPEAFRKAVGEAGYRLSKERTLVHPGESNRTKASP